MRLRLVELGVGAFILAGVVALAILVVNVSGLSMNSAGDSYKVYAHFENIAGLTPRSKVTISGVTIGQVTNITIDPKKINARVEMDIESAYDYLSIDSSASILTAGLLGEKYIGITVGGDPDVLGDGDEIEDTQSALVLEELIGKFLFDKVSE